MSSLSKPHRSAFVDPVQLSGSGRPSAMALGALGLAVVGRTGVLPPTVPPTVVRSKPLVLEPPPRRTPRATPAAAPDTSRSTAAATAARRPKTSTAPKKKAAVASTSTAKKVTTKDAKSNSASPPSEPAAPATAPPAPIPVAAVPTSAPSSSRSSAPSSRLPFRPRHMSGSLFPEYSAEFVAKHSSLLHTADALTAPYLTPIPADTPTPQPTPPTETAVNAPRSFKPDAHGHLCIPLTDLVDAVEFVHSAGRTALVLDATEKVDAFYSYNPTQMIEAKKLFLAKMHGAATLDDQLEHLRMRLLTAMKHGHTLLISLADSAVDFLTQYNGKDTFPTRTVFDPQMIRDSSQYAPLLRPFDRDDIRGIWYGVKSVHDEFRVVVTSRFDPDDASEFLRESIPLDRCTIIRIHDPDAAT